MYLFPVHLFPLSLELNTNDTLIPTPVHLWPPCPKPNQPFWVLISSESSKEFDIGDYSLLWDTCPSRGSRTHTFPAFPHIHGYFFKISFVVSSKSSQLLSSRMPSHPWTSFFYLNSLCVGDLIQSYDFKYHPEEAITPRFLSQSQTLPLTSTLTSSVPYLNISTGYLPRISNLTCAMANSFPVFNSFQWHLFSSFPSQ